MKNWLKILAFSSFTSLLGLGGLLVAPTATAALIIEISEGYENALPIAVIPLQVQGEISQDIGAIVEHNLRRSGRFKPLTAAQMPQQPANFEQIDFADWRMINIDHLIFGSVKEVSKGRYDISLHLVDVLRKTQVVASAWQQVSANQLRKIAHQFSDKVYEEMTGIKGAFDTKLAYVTLIEQNQERIYTLEVSDSDGYNPKPILRSKMPIMSPAWSPDGRQLAYVSFESGRSNVVLQNLSDGKREILAQFPGINSAPAWSPDGKNLSMTLSKDGNADIYIMNLQTRKLQKITRHWAIETESAWSPDGKDIYFNSDRRGQPQIFKVNLNSRIIERISFEGRYNSNPKVSPDGRYVAMVHNNGGFNIGLLDTYNQKFQVLTDSFLSESPSFAPNSDMLVYAMNRGGKGQLAVVSKDGRSSQILRVKEGQVREPAWGPFLTK